MMRAWWTGMRFVAGSVAVLAAAYAASEALAPVHAATGARAALFRERAPELEAVSVGNSHGAALDYGALGVRGMHFWEAGQDPFEAMFMVRHAAERAPRLRYALITASYGFERLDNAAATSRDYTAIRRRTYLRTGARGYIPGDRDLWIAARLSPVARTDHWSGVAARLAGLPRPAVRLTRDGTPWQPAPPPISADSLARHAARQAGMHHTRAAESLANRPETPSRTAAELEALAGELRGRGIVLVLYTPPYHETYLREVPAEVVEGTRRALAPALRHPNVVWLDFGSHPAFVRRDELYTDSDHLNPEGARRFSALLRRCLAALPAAGGSAAESAGCPGGTGPRPTAE